MGDAGCFSFFADKTITTGEGGYVVCRDAAVHRRLLYLRNQGRLKRGSFIHDEIGYNFPNHRHPGGYGTGATSQAGRHNRGQARTPPRLSRGAWRRSPRSGCSTPTPEDGFVPFRCVLMAERAGELMAWLEARNIEVRTVFAPLHRQPCFAEHPSVIAGKLGRLSKRGFRLRTRRLPCRCSRN